MATANAAKLPLIPQAEADQIDLTLDYSYLTQDQANALRLVAYHSCRHNSPPTIGELAGYLQVRKRIALRLLKSLVRHGKVLPTACVRTRFVPALGRT
jgi:DNA-binding MarR family transcriptional regulator